MNILLMLIPIALIIISVAVWFFFWAIKSEQFDDLDRQGSSILFDDDLATDLKKPPAESTKPSAESTKPSAKENGLAEQRSRSSDVVPSDVISESKSQDQHQ